METFRKKQTVAERFLKDEKILNAVIEKLKEGEKPKEMEKKTFRDAAWEIIVAKHPGAVGRAGTPDSQKKSKELEEDIDAFWDKNFHKPPILTIIKYYENEKKKKEKAKARAEASSSSSAAVAAAVPAAADAAYADVTDIDMNEFRQELMMDQAIATLMSKGNTRKQAENILATPIRINKLGIGGRSTTRRHKRHKRHTKGRKRHTKGHKRHSKGHKRHSKGHKKHTKKHRKKHRKRRVTRRR